MSISNYSQPDFYRFNVDSIELVNAVIEDLDVKQIYHLADFCCGCGVVGIEFFLKFKDVLKISFFEKQQEFAEHLVENLKNIEVESEIFLGDLILNNSEENFDLILMNPPYYNERNYRKGPNRLRNECRLYKDDELRKIIDKAIKSLAPLGSLYIVHREDLSRYNSKLELIKKGSECSIFRFTLNK